MQGLCLHFLKAERYTPGNSSFAAESGDQDTAEAGSLGPGVRPHAVRCLLHSLGYLVCTEAGAVSLALREVCGRLLVALLAEHSEDTEHAEVSSMQGPHGDRLQPRAWPEKQGS